MIFLISGDETSFRPHHPVTMATPRVTSLCGFGPPLSQFNSVFIFADYGSSILDADKKRDVTLS